MKKKLLAMVLAAATAMTMLAGCGGGGEKAYKGRPVRR